jgi:hypothetical protein
MPATGLFGPHPLTEKNIEAVVLGVGPGAYALGRDGGNIFYVSYVGRSDNDLNARLKQWVASGYTHFQYAFYPTSKAAFEKECHLFHDFGGTAKLDNVVHPARPNGTTHPCPVSGCGDLR